MFHALGQELAFHAPLVLKDEFLAALLVEINAAVLRFEVFGIENLVAEEIQGQRFNENGPERFDEIEGQGPAAVLDGVEESQRGIEPVGVNESNGFGIE